LQEKINSREFAEWQAYDEIEPFGELRADLRAGIVAHAAANAPYRKPYPNSVPAHFMPDFEKEEGDDGQQSDKEMMANMAMAFGVKIDDGSDR